MLMSLCVDIADGHNNKIEGHHLEETRVNPSNSLNRPSQSSSENITGDSDESARNLYSEEMREMLDEKNNVDGDDGHDSENGDDESNSNLTETGGKVQNAETASSEEGVSLFICRCAKVLTLHFRSYHPLKTRSGSNAS